MKGKRTIIALLAVSLCAMLLPDTSRAQVIAGITLEKLGILTTPGTGARPYAVGGAYTAVSDDAFALLYNPAGLAQIRRKEISFGLHHVKNDIRNEYLDLAIEQSGSYTSLAHLTAVYPYPTYRGSLVFGFGIFRVGTSDLETTKIGSLEDIVTVGTISENRYNQSGNIYQYHVGMGIDVSPRIALGGGFVVWDESIDFTEEVIYEDPGSLAVYADNVSMDLDGFSFNLGLLIRFHESIRAGLMITSPTWLSYEGDGIINYDGEYTAGGGWTTDPDYSLIDEEYTLPMQFRGGIAIRLADLLLSADVSYIDYSQTKWNGLTLNDEFDLGGRHVLKDTWNFYAGAELTLPWYPVRIRGGFSYVPLLLHTIEEIAYIENDEVTAFVADFETVRERKQFTFGIGALVDRVLALDLGVAISGFERDTGFYTEERNTVEVVLSSAYRF